MPRQPANKSSWPTSAEQQDAWKRLLAETRSARAEWGAELPLLDPVGHIDTGAVLDMPSEARDRISVRLNKKFGNSSPPPAPPNPWDCPTGDVLAASIARMYWSVMENQPRTLLAMLKASRQLERLRVGREKGSAEFRRKGRKNAEAIDRWFSQRNVSSEQRGAAAACAKELGIDPSIVSRHLRKRIRSD